MGAAPTQLNIHGTADAQNDILDEGAGVSLVHVTDFKSKKTREVRERKNYNGCLRRKEYFNPLLAITLSAFLVGNSGLNTQEVGTRVTSLANFAAASRGMDPTVGSMILEDAEDSWTQTEDVKSSMSILHAPFVVPAG